jgi:hypothetical protein
VIGPVHRFADLLPHHDGERYLVPPNGLTRDDLDRHAEDAGRELGITFDERPCLGAYFVVDRPDGSKAQLERVAYYTLVKHDEILDGVRATIEAVHREFGPGRAWTLGGRVHVITDDGGDVAVDVRGVWHLLLRAWVCHENGPTRDRPRVPLTRANLRERLRPGWICSLCHDVSGTARIVRAIDENVVYCVLSDGAGDERRHEVTP